MDKLRVHAGDDRPSLYLQIRDIQADVAVDLSPSTTSITAKFREKGTTTVLDTITCSKVGSGATGWVQMDWDTDTLDVDEGNYEIELSVSFDGEIQTVNYYYWDGASSDTASTFPVKVVDDF